jgi:hypothetical protein
MAFVLFTLKEAIWMDFDIERRIRRIEGRIDALLGLVLMALGFWCADRMAVLFHREMGWNRDWMFFASAVGIYAAFVFWFGRLMNRP